MTPFALYLWDNNRDIFIYELGEFDNAEQAQEEAQRIMRSEHKEFVESDSPCWQVGPFRSLIRHSVANLTD
jgi:hypothetical protein